MTKRKEKGGKEKEREERERGEGGGRREGKEGVNKSIMNEKTHIFKMFQNKKN